MKNLLYTYFEISVFCSAVIIITAILARLSRRKSYSSRWRYYIWLVLAIRMIIPVNLQLIQVPPLFPAAADNPVLPDTLMSQETPAGSTDSGTAAIGRSNTEKAPVISDHQMQPARQTVPSQVQNHKKRFLFTGKDIFNVLPIIWLIGAGIFLLYHTVTYAAFLYKLKRWRIPAAGDETEPILVRLSEELRISKKISLEVCRYAQSPMIVGILYPKIILPSGRFSAARTELVIQHELIHYKHHDIAFKLLLLCMNALHWFNPLAYYAVRCANHDMEIFCDETVVSQKDEEYRKAYSYAILQTIVKQSSNNHIAISTYFDGGKKQMKDRFKQIMNSSPKKRGTVFFALLSCLILLTVAAAAGTHKGAGNGKVPDNKAEAAAVTAPVRDSTDSDSKDTGTEQIKAILLIGTDSIGGLKRADTIILAGIRPDSKDISLISFLRDTYVKLPDNGKTKLSHAYETGGAKLLEETLEDNFNLTIDGTVEVSYKGFTDTVDLLGGVKISLTEQEASYLNHTNYISNPANRVLKAGEQRLNGDQALGYARIRHVKTSNGTGNDFGRAERNRDLLISAFNECKAADIQSLLSLLNTALSNISTDLGKEQIISCLNTVMKSEYTVQSVQIPAEGTYQPAVTDGYSVLDADIAANQKILRQLLQPGTKDK